ncbi:hypothetical protein H2O64_03655 [Kordia sp. YSTF-M3]|uniref:Uncharacterized protein n=1 Tax=Kordia aestuariivivens TaxID=2759037 RepID=A0ABR7Q5C6_9FLAO|nr:hypothetical protein [Kordia aestuariivivens]MBC8753750.1 hypothetical protein [Kordia aestuariivivens]
MKKQMKTLGLKKQTVSSLEASLVQGGAPTTHSMVTMEKWCVSQLICEPVPQEPTPITNQSHSNCGQCSVVCG